MARVEAKFVNGAMLVIKATTASIEKITRDLAAHKKAQAIILSRAVNKVATAARTEINREVRKNLSIKAGDLNKTIKLIKANAKRPQAKIKIKGRRIALAKFAAKPTNTGVSYRISPKEGRKKIRHTFLATMKSSHVGVFTREGDKRKMKSGRYTGPKLVDFWARGRRRLFIAREQKRQPILEKFGPSVNAVFENIKEFAQAKLDSRIADQLEREIITQIGVFEQQQRGNK